MKLTGIRLVGPSTVDLPLEYEEVEGPYVLKGTDQLGPVDEILLPNGKKSPGQRVPVLLVGLQPDWNGGQTPDDLRTELYDLINPRYGGTMQMQLMDGATVLAYAEGQITKMIPGLHTPDPEVQITMECIGATRSYFLAPAETLALPAAAATITVDNAGSAPSGFRIGIQFTAPVAKATGVIITDNHVGGQAMKVYRDFVSGDRLFIDTRVGQKGVWIQPNGQPGLLPIIENLSLDSDWSVLHRGANQININQPYIWPAVVGGVRYTPAYLGV